MAGVPETCRNQWRDPRDRGSIWPQPAKVVFSVLKGSNIEVVRRYHQKLLQTRNTIGPLFRKPLYR